MYSAAVARRKLINIFGYEPSHLVEDCEGLVTEADIALHLNTLLSEEEEMYFDE